MKIFFETLGCPKNFNDSEVAKGFLIKDGFELADNPDDADVIVVNTCGFINDAKRESIERIFEMAEYKAGGKKLVVSGCLSERYSQELTLEMPEVDMFIGVNEYHKLPEILKSLGNFEKRCNVTHSHDDFLKYSERVLSDNPYSATLKIAEGCDNRCAYCVIPHIRGSFRSKKEEDILNEAEILASKGCKELILIAQDVTIYGYDLYGKRCLPKLLRSLVKIDGIEWIRLMYCYEDRIDDELIEVIKDEPKICKYIDIPIQHSSDSVLRSMRRRSTAESIRDTIKKLREAVPDIAIRTTLIVGFPGETEKDFEELLNFVSEQRFSRLGCFAYSREEGTVAGDMDNQIEESVKQERLDRVMRLQLEISYELNRNLIGKTLSVLVEARDDDGSYIGRTEYDAPEIDNSVIFSANRELEAGDIVKVEIIDAYDYDLVGREVEEQG